MGVASLQNRTVNKDGPEADGDSPVSGLDSANPSPLAHAIVIGASTTGLACAAVAAQHFRRVTVLDRDQLPEQPVWRRGVPQGRHVHALLRGGQAVFDRYVPGLTDRLRKAGSVEVDMGSDVLWHHFGGWKARFHSGVSMLCQSKGFLEWHIRQQLALNPCIEFRSHCNVTGLNGGPDRITGVQLQDGRQLSGDLVIDASGRNSNTPRFLEQLGIAPPRQTQLPVDIWYASQIFAAASAPRDWRGMLIHSRPPATRTAALMPIEGGRWIVTLVGWQGDNPGSKQDAFLEWARGLPAPKLFDSIVDAEPLDRVWRWNFASNQRNHYEACQSFPDGLVVVGDANTSLNPIYGQGMSQGAIGARILDQCLTPTSGQTVANPLAGLGPRFHRCYGKFIDQCWMTSTTEDYSELAGQDGRAWYAPLLSRYLHRFTQLTWHNRDAAHAFYQVMHMEKSPTSLMRPGFLLRAMARPMPTPESPPSMHASQH